MNGKLPSDFNRGIQFCLLLSGDEESTHCFSDNLPNLSVVAWFWCTTELHVYFAFVISRYTIYTQKSYNACTL